MTTRYKYECDKCGFEYIEQRSDSELTPFFPECTSCHVGQNVEVEKVKIEDDPVPTPIEETVAPSE